MKIFYRVSVFDWKTLRYIVKHAGVSKKRGDILAAQYRERGNMVLVRPCAKIS